MGVGSSQPRPPLPMKAHVLPSQSRRVPLWACVALVCLAVAPTLRAQSLYAYGTNPGGTVVVIHAYKNGSFLSEWGIAGGESYNKHLGSWNPGETLSLKSGPLGGPVTTSVGSYVVQSAPDPQTYSFTASAAPTPWQWKGKFQNDTGYGQYYQFGANGEYGPPVYVPPGAYYEFSFSGDSQVDLHGKRITYAPDGSQIVEFSENISSSHSGWYQGTPPGGDLPTFSDGQNIQFPEVPDFSSNLNWAPNTGGPSPDFDTSDLAKEATLRRGFESTVGTLQGGFQALNKELQSIRGRAETHAAANNAGLAGINSQLVTANANINQIAGSAASIDGRLITANTSLNGINDGVAGLRGDVALGAKEITQAGLRADTVAGFSSLQTSVGEVKTELIDGKAQAHQDSLATQGEIQDVGDKVDGIKDAVNALPRHYGPETLNHEAEGAAGESAASDTKGDFDTLAGTLGNPASVPSGMGGFWQITLPGGLGVLNLNPLDDPEVAAFAEWARGFILWLLTASLFGLVIFHTSDAIKAAGGWQQTKGVQTQVNVAGFGFATSVFSALIIRGIIGAALLAIPAYSLAWMSNNDTLFATLGVNPLAPTSGAVAAGLWLADQFVPLVALVGFPMLALGFQTTLAGVLFSKQMVVRYLPS